jgi:hypothetical protein
MNGKIFTIHRYIVFWALLSFGAIVPNALEETYHNGGHMQ